MTPITCACPACQSMCRRSVCIPTPDEARVLIRRYPQRMARYPNQNVIAPRTVGGAAEAADTAGRCTFHTDDGRCELHEVGLKPFEGRMACHDRNSDQIRWRAISHWAGRRYESVSKALDKR